MKPNLGITENHSQMVAEELNKILADEVVLYIQTRNYHWNIEGPNFNQLHAFYETQFNELDEVMDQVAERIRVIGHYTEARMGDYLRLTNLVEQPYTNLQSDQLKNLLASHETIIRSLRTLVPIFQETYLDIGTGDFVTQLLSRHEKMAWLIRSSLL